MTDPKVIIFTRFHYDEDIPQSTLFCFKNYYLPSLKNQTNKNFEVIILANNNLANTRIIQSFVDRSGIKDCINVIDKDDYILYVNEIECNLDNDDAVDKDYVAEIIRQYHANPEDTFLVVFFYLKYSVEQNKYYTPFLPTKENRGFPTPFYALIQKGERKFNWASRKHNELDEVINRVVVVEGKVCTMNIRGENTSNKIYEGEEEA
jgi:hypothetical protein